MVARDIMCAGSAKDGADMRGAFVNTAEARCSIHESGRMVFQSISGDPGCEIDYYSIDQIDLELFLREGQLAWTGGGKSGFVPPSATEYDFWVFNWHFYTMAMVTPDCIRRLPGIKITVVLELAPDEPLKLVPAGVFDAYIALDPTIERFDSVFPFPRPLEGVPWAGEHSERAVPVIGSFGFGTPGKGFELLVEAVNREFARAVVRINVPHGDYVNADAIHDESYPARLERLCKAIAAPGIEVRFTRDFMSPEQLLAWCADNDLNCFMYTRCQPGLSATTDQAIMSGRPLLTLSNDTFRHIHGNIPPYPQWGLRHALRSAAPYTAKLRQEWSRESFRARFHGMLRAMGLFDGPGAAAPAAAPRPAFVMSKILVLTGHDGTGGRSGSMDRAIQALSRSDSASVVAVAAADADQAKAAAGAMQPAAIVFLEVATAEMTAALAAVADAPGTRICVTADPAGVALLRGMDRATDVIMPRQPIIPFVTSTAHRRRPHRIWLLGFSHAASELEGVLDRLAKELPGAEQYVEVADNELATVQARIAAAAARLGPGHALSAQVVAVPASEAEALAAFAEASLVVVSNDPARTEALIDLVCLTLATERPVLFMRSATFPVFAGREAYFADMGAAQAIALGIAVNIKLRYEFGEWQFAAGLRRLVDASTRGRAADAWMRDRSTPEGPVVLAMGDFLQFAFKAEIGVPPVRREDLASLPAPLPVVTIPTEPRLPVSYAAARGTSPSLFLVVGLAGSDLAKLPDHAAGLAHAWARSGESVHLVVWNAVTKSLQALDHAQWFRLGIRPIPAAGLATPPGEGRNGVDVAPPLCRDGDWVLVTEAYGPGQAGRPLIEVDIILLARRLRLHCAFTYGDALPLRAPGHAGTVAEHFELHMQAMLLADLIVTTGRRASDEVNDFFVQHQHANFVPLIRHLAVPPPSREGYGGEWDAYARRLRGLFDTAADPTRHLVSLYVLVDPGSDAASAAAAEALAASLLGRGIDLVAATWDGAAERLVAAPAPAEDSVCSGDGRWTGWVDPGARNAPGWLLVAGRPGGRTTQAVARWAAANGLRSAVVLHERPAGAGEEPDETAFAGAMGADKVLAVSEDRFRTFYRHLLASREKVHSAEDRFKVLPQPVHHTMQPRRRSRKATTSGILQGVIWLADPGFIRSGVDAAAAACLASPLRLRLTFVAPPSARDAELADAIAAVPGARWMAAPDESGWDRLLQAADFGVFADKRFQGSALSAQSASLLLPRLVHQDMAESPATPRPGTVLVDLTDAASATAALMDLVDEDWRSVLSREAAAEPQRTWDGYALALATELATDRPRDTVHAPDTTPRPNIHHRLPNLHWRPRLSISISTYNRAGWLGVNLRNIFTQLPVAGPEVEILVVDNASPDNTPDVVAPYLGRTDFRYVRNVRNVGMLGNLAVTAQQSRGDYIWILGDDDLTRPGAVQRVLAVLRDYPKLALINMNYGYTSERDPSTVKDLDCFLSSYNLLEPANADQYGTVQSIAAKTENFYTAIYSHVYRRDHGLRAYSQDTSGRIFSTMRSCIPTSYYCLHFMADEPAYWIGDQMLVVNSNVSWQDYGPLLDLEQLPRAWDLSERMGTDPAEVDRRRANRLWLVELMWSEILENDKAGNSPYVAVSRIVLRLKHLPEFENHVDAMANSYRRAYWRQHPAATMEPDELFAAFQT